MIMNVYQCLMHYATNVTQLYELTIMTYNVTYYQFIYIGQCDCILLVFSWRVLRSNTIFSKGAIGLKLNYIFIGHQSHRVCFPILCIHNFSTTN